MLEALGHLADPTLLIAVLVAVLGAQVVAVTPGLGGAFLLAILIPFLFPLEPLVAVSVLIAASATDGTGNSVTSILFGVPGSATGTAALFDGHPMAKQGLAGRAIGAAMAASMIGGVIGAITLALVIPVVRPVVLAFGPPEFFILVVAALLALSFVREESVVKGLVGGALGLTFAFVGMDGSTGTQRFTFDQLYLWDGLKLVPVLLGLFAIPEVINLLVAARSGDAEGTGTDRDDAPDRVGDVREGVKDAFRHIDATWVSSWTGLLVGILPGVGGAAGQFMGYSAVARMRVSPARAERWSLPPFGQGNVRGVIAADASTNSTLGGELVPTLAFGIPGSSTMAIVLAALVSVGITPGPAMLETELDIVWLIIFVLVLSNVLATGVVLAFARQLAKLIDVRPALLAPSILVVCLFGSYATSRHVGDILTTAGIGVLGYLLQKYGFGRVTFIIGFVLGPILEHYFILSLQIFGPGFLLARPLSIGMTAALVIGVLWSTVRQRRRASAATDDTSAMDEVRS